MSIQGVAFQLWRCDPNDPDRLSTPFFDASALAAFDVPVELYFTARSVLLLAPGVADSLYSGSQQNKSVGDYLREAHAHGARIYACTDALQAHGLSLGGLIAQCDGPGGVVQFTGRLIDPSWRCLVF